MLRARFWLPIVAILAQALPALAADAPGALVRTIEGTYFDTADVLVWPVAPIGRNVAEEQGWTLTFRDEFDGATLDGTKWTASNEGRPSFGMVPSIASEDPAYPVGARGVLQLRIDQHTRPTDAVALGSLGTFAQRYGYLEARIKMVKTHGFAGAFWVLPSDDHYKATRLAPTNVWEMDITEFGRRLCDGDATPQEIADNPGLDTTLFCSDTQFSAHDADLQDENSTPFATREREVKLPFDPGKGFHTYGLEWTPERVVWYVDHVPVHRLDPSKEVAPLLGPMIPDTPFYILLSMYKGGSGMLGSRQDLAQTIEFDYVRVWAPPAARPPVAAGPVVLRSGLGDRCLASTDAAPRSALALASGCSSDAATWRVASGAASFTLTNVATGDCLDVRGGSRLAEAVVQQYPCNGTPAQQWLTRRAFDDGSVEVLNVGSGKCLDVAGDDGSQDPLRQRDCDNGATHVLSQQWSLAAP